APSRSQPTLEEATALTPPAPTERDKPHRLPGAGLSHGGWLYDHLPLSYRAGTALRCARGLPGASAAGPPWGRQGGQAEAQRRRRPQPGETWQLDEGLVTSKGQRHSLGHAGEQADPGLALLGHRRRNTPAAKQGFRQRLHGWQDAPRGIIP